MSYSLVAKELRVRLALPCLPGPAFSHTPPLPSCRSDFRKVEIHLDAWLGRLDADSGRCLVARAYPILREFGRESEEGKIKRTAARRYKRGNRQLLVEEVVRGTTQ